LVRFGQIWSDLVIRVTPFQMHFTDVLDAWTHGGISPQPCWSAPCTCCV